MTHHRAARGCRTIPQHLSEPCPAARRRFSLAPTYLAEGRKPIYLDFLRPIRSRHPVNPLPTQQSARECHPVIINLPLSLHCIHPSSRVKSHAQRRCLTFTHLLSFSLRKALFVSRDARSLAHSHSPTIASLALHSSIFAPYLARIASHRIASHRIASHRAHTRSRTG